MKLTALMAGLMLALAPAAQAATIWATSVVEYAPGAGTLAPLGANPANALGDPTLGGGNFASLGDGGYIVLDFGGDLLQSLTVFERTNICGAAGGSCTAWPEQADVYVGISWTAGLGDFATANAVNGFVQLFPTVQNAGPVTIPGLANVRGTTLASGVLFKQVVIVDRSAALPGNPDRFQSNSGFDVVAVGGVAPIPLPAAAWMLISALGGMALISRRRKAA